MNTLQKLGAWLRGEEYVETAEEEYEESDRAGHLGRSGSAFSTDLPFPRKSLTKWLQKNASLPTPSFKSVRTGTEQMTMDQAMDAYGMDSSALKQGFTTNTDALPEVLFSWYVSQSFIRYQACAIISQNWLVNKALMIPAKDAVRNGYTVTRNDGKEIDPEILDALKALDKRFKIKKNLIEFDTNKRRFGIRVAIFNVESDDPRYYEKPFNIDGVKPGSYKGISQVDPHWMAPILDAQSVANPASQNFYEPTWWQINGNLYHRSHLAIVRYVDVPDILKPTYQYGGMPLTQLIYERVYAAERVANEAPMLVETKRLTTINTDIAQIVANPERFEQNLAQLTHYRNNYNVFIQGLEESMSQFDTALTDVDTVIMTEYQLVAAVAEVPATKLLGTSPKGFNATGEFETESYYDLLENTQTDMDVMLDRHHQLVVKSHIAPRFKIPHFELITVWEPVDSPSAKEQSEINMNNSATDLNLVGAGSIDGNDSRNRIIEDPKSGYNGLESFAEFEPDDEESPGGDPAEQPGVENTAVPVPGGQGQDSAFGYVSVVPDRLQAKSLYDWVHLAGINNGLPPEKLHVTLGHDPSGILNYEPDKVSYAAEFTGEIGILGDGEYEALVMYIDSQALRMRHEALKAMGMEFKFDQFRPHISLKYKPAPGDLEKMQEQYNKTGSPGTLKLDNERLRLLR